MKDFLTVEDNLLLKEAGLASSCIGQGLTILKKANFVNKWNYYQAFFLLTIGIERLLKIIIVSKYRADNQGKFPSNLFLKRLGHDIQKLIQIVEAYDCSKDKNDNIHDEIQIDIIVFFTKFAKESRYYNLDALTGLRVQTDPLSDWRKIQEKIKVKEGLVSEPLPKGYADFINSYAIFVQHDEDGNLVSNAEDFYKDWNILDKLQGYSILYIWKILQILVDKLRCLEYKNNLFPTLREFFPYFIKGWDRDIDVTTWEDWNYLK